MRRRSGWRAARRRRSRALKRAVYEGGSAPLAAGLHVERPAFLGHRLYLGRADGDGPLRRRTSERSGSPAIADPDAFRAWQDGTVIDLVRQQAPGFWAQKPSKRSAGLPAGGGVSFVSVSDGGAPVPPLGVVYDGVLGSDCVQVVSVGTSYRWSSSSHRCRPSARGGRSSGTRPAARTCRRHTPAMRSRLRLRRPVATALSQEVVYGAHGDQSLPSAGDAAVAVGAFADVHADQLSAVAADTHVLRSPRDGANETRPVAAASATITIRSQGHPVVERDVGHVLSPLRTTIRRRPEAGARSRSGRAAPMAARKIPAAVGPLSPPLGARPPPGDSGSAASIRRPVQQSRRLVGALGTRFTVLGCSWACVRR